jgi:hypothetical protein
MQKQLSMQFGAKTITSSLTVRIQGVCFGLSTKVIEKVSGLREKTMLTWMLRTVHAVAFTAIVFLAIGCDVVYTKYETKQVATKDGQVAGGWLPLSIPQSAFDINTANNLDFNTSTGTFRFAPSDGALFSSVLAVTSTASPPFSNWPQKIKQMQEQGYVLKFYTEDTTTWAFFCKFKQGECEYFMWLQKNASSTLSIAVS